MHTTRQRCCKIKASRNSIFTSIQWQCHQVYRALSSRKYFLAFPATLTFSTHPLASCRVAEIETIGHTRYRRKQLSKSADSCRFARPSTPTDKDPTNQRIDGVEDEGKLHLVLPNQSTQWKCCHVPYLHVGCVQH